MCSLFEYQMIFYHFGAVKLLIMNDNTDEVRADLTTLKSVG